MQIIINILGFVLLFGLIITVHEFGHFYFAKKAGILCYEFSFGMGPAIFQKKVGETTYSIRLLPIGGFVSMAGEELSKQILKPKDNVKLKFNGKSVEKIIVNDIDNKYSELESFEVLEADLYAKETNKLYIKVVTSTGEVKDFDCLENGFYCDGKTEIQFAPYSRCFESKSFFARFKSIVFGPLSNFILAIVVMFLLFLFTGEAKKDSTVIESVIQGRPAELQGFESGDEILSINGHIVSTYEEITEELNVFNPENEYVIEFKRDGKIDTIDYKNVYYFNSIGLKSNLDSSEIYSLEDSIAYNAGIRTGDVIKNVDGVEITDFYTLANLLDENKTGKSMSFTVLRQGETLSFELNPYDEGIMNNQNVQIVDTVFGIEPERQFSLLYAFKEPFVFFGNTLYQIIDTVRLLFVSDQVGVSNLSGPVGIFSMISNALSSGLFTYISLGAMLSINIGLINLLPIPALDGGRLLMLLIEKITRKEINKKFENTLNSVFLILLLVFMAYVTFNDILRLT